MQPGDIIADKFRVERVLGQGGMGVVVVATHLQLDQTVALKFLHENIAWDAGVIERLIREARASAKLKTEHVCRVMDVGQLPTGTPYIVMELLEGQDLSSVIRRAPLVPAVAAEYVLQACVAIAEAHAAGIVHRDLKPSNMFVTERLDGTPLIKVLDFGIAKAQSKANVELTRTAAVMGSPGYMSPEQLRSAKDVDARTDIWSLGVILYEAVSGTLPFQAETITELAVKVSMDPFVPLVTDPAYAAVVARCLEKPVASRYQNVNELAFDLARIAGAKGATSATMIARLSGQRPVAVPSSVERPASVPAIAETLPATAPEAPVVVESSTPARRDKTPVLPPPMTTLSSAAMSRMAPSGSSKKPLVFAGIGLVAVGGIVTAVLATGGNKGSQATAPSGSAGSGSAEPAARTKVALTISETLPNPEAVSLTYNGTTERLRAHRSGSELEARLIVGFQGTERFVSKAMFGELASALDQFQRTRVASTSMAMAFSLGKQASQLYSGRLSAIGLPTDTQASFRDQIVFSPDDAIGGMLDTVEKTPFEGRTFVLIITSSTKLSEQTSKRLEVLSNDRFEFHFITVLGDDDPSGAKKIGEQVIKKPAELLPAIASITDRMARDMRLEFEVDEAKWRAADQATVTVGGAQRYRIEPHRKTSIVLP